MTATGGELLSEHSLDYDAWHNLQQSMCGNYNTVCDEPELFSGSIRAASICGFTAVDISSFNVQYVDRTDRDLRRDGRDQYKITFQVSGRSTFIQNGQSAELSVGQFVLVDIARPMTIVPGNSACRWRVLYLPRQPVIAHLGSEPNGGLFWRDNALAGRLLFQLTQEALGECEPDLVSAEPHMQLAVYDLLGALIAGSDAAPRNAHADKLFARVCRIIKAHICDPGIGPREVAAEAGISLRYLQKLFTARGTTCSLFIQSLRLDHAAQLLHRQALTRRTRSISEIAYASGFRDYAHFARSFRQHFGCPPGAFSRQHARAEPMRIRTSESTF